MTDPRPNALQQIKQGRAALEQAGFWFNYAVIAREPTNCGLFFYQPNTGRWFKLNRFTVDSLPAFLSEQSQ